MLRSRPGPSRPGGPRRQRGYRGSLTVVFVLRPEFGAAVGRGTRRHVATPWGAALPTLSAARSAPARYATAALATVLALAEFAFLRANSALFSTSTTGWTL